MTEFERFIGIDWSGAATDDDRVALRIVETTVDGRLDVISPETDRAVKNWNRREARKYLAQQLTTEAPRTLVGIDAALGYPAGADRAVFDAKGWREMVATIAEVMKQTRRVPRFADHINANHSDGRGVPFFSRHKGITERDWWRKAHEPHGFFTEKGISYYRLIDTLVPQALSAFYMGPGAMVGGHTITCLNTLDSLLEERDRDEELDFGVWLHEPNWRDRKHLIVESYPAILPEPTGDHPGASRDLLDAIRIASWLSKLAPTELSQHLNFHTKSAGLARLVTHEGWILGVPAPASPPAQIEIWNGD